mgnify:CR=1 FL=1
MSEILGWHFLRDDGTRAQDGVRVEPGATETWNGPLELCKSGLHFCVRPLDALSYARGALVRRVRLSGDILQSEGADKGCATVREELWRADVTTLLHEFARDVAEQELDALAARGGTVDPRSRAVLDVKRRWARGDATDAELNAAWDAASGAVWDAGSVIVGVVVRVVFLAAVWHVVGAAARNAAWDAINADLERRLLALPVARRGGAE